MENNIIDDTKDVEEIRDSSINKKSRLNRILCIIFGSIMLIFAISMLLATVQMCRNMGIFSNPASGEYSIGIFFLNLIGVIFSWSIGFVAGLLGIMLIADK